MEELLKIIDAFTSASIKNENEKAQQFLNMLNNKMFDIFPKIIAAYSRPEMQEHSQDALLWPKQLEKILGAIDAKDNFGIVDILFYETKSMIINFAKQANSKGVQI